MYEIVRDIRDIHSSEEIVQAIPVTKRIAQRIDDFDNEYTEEEIVDIEYLVKDNNPIRKKLNKFVLKYQGNGILKTIKNYDSYKIFKAFSLFDLLNQLENFEEELQDDWKIISDVQVENINGLKIYWVEAVRIDNDALEMF